MKDRKLQVIESALKLFMKNGYQATSIQDILEDSGISKGTFYNYFSSKQEVLIEGIKNIHHEVGIRRDSHILNHRLDDKEILIEQILITIDAFKQQNMAALLSEISFSNQQALKKVQRKIYLQHMRWVMERLVDVFGPSIQKHALDLTVLFTNIIIGLFRFNHFEVLNHKKHKEIAHYALKQIEILAHEAVTSGEVLFPVKLFDEKNALGTSEQIFSSNLIEAINSLKFKIKSVITDKEQIEQQMDLIDFLAEELLHSNVPRISMIDSTLHYLQYLSRNDWKVELHNLSTIINNRLKKKKEN